LERHSFTSSATVILRMMSFIGLSEKRVSGNPPEQYASTIRHIRLLKSSRLMDGRMPSSASANVIAEGGVSVLSPTSPFLYKRSLIWFLSTRVTVVPSRSNPCGLTSRRSQRALRLEFCMFDLFFMFPLVAKAGSRCPWLSFLR
jgi:hypothetical protein